MSAADALAVLGGVFAAVALVLAIIGACSWPKHRAAPWCMAASLALASAAGSFITAAWMAVPT